MAESLAELDCFNGAVTLWPRKVQAMMIDAVGRMAFNGAVTLWPRKAALSRGFCR